MLPQVDYIGESILSQSVKPEGAGHVICVAPKLAGGARVKASLVQLIRTSAREHRGLALVEPGVRRQSLHDALSHSDDECAICLQNITEGTSLRCRHSFCRTCISRWLQSSSSCPTCRRPCRAGPGTGAVFQGFIDDKVELLLAACWGAFFIVIVGLHMEIYAGAWQGQVFGFSSVIAGVLIVLLAMMLASFGR